MSRKVLLEIGNCGECPHWDGFMDFCDFEEDEYTIDYNANGEIPHNCPLYLGQKFKTRLTEHPVTPNEAHHKSFLNALSWNKKQ